MLSTVSEESVSNVYQQALNNGLINDEDTSIIFYDRDKLYERLDHLNEIFPSDVFHTIPIKTNPLAGLLKEVYSKGMGLEAASVEEMELAREAGIPDSAFVFDSPVKTRKEIETCIQYYNGAFININNLEELNRYPSTTELEFGLRINPELNTGAPDLFNVGYTGSKFGEPVSNKHAIINACLNRKEISALHVHSGSEIDPVKNAKAVALIHGLADEINQARKNAGIKTLIRYINIGGGVPATFIDAKQYGIEKYYEALLQECPGLFKNYKVITEFGRFVHTANGWCLSDIEYVKEFSSKEPSMAFIHLGADMFVRQIYASGNNNLGVTVLDADGTLLRAKNKKQYSIAGPLCFNGDYLLRSIKLPGLREGYKLVIKNTGANTNALWSVHCSRDFPKVILYSESESYMTILSDRKKGYLFAL